jgi:type VI secretion system Hcp family effector
MATTHEIRKILFKMKLQTQGALAGDIKLKEGALDFAQGMVANAYQLQVDAQYDQATHMGTGRRIWKALRIVKHVDSCSAALAQACTSNEQFTEASLSFNRPGPDGKVLKYHSIVLTNGLVVHYSQFHGNTHNERSATFGDGQIHTNEIEIIELTFDKITINIDAASKSMSDQWSQRT